MTKRIGDRFHTFEEAFEWLGKESIRLFKDHKDFDKRCKRSITFDIIDIFWINNEKDKDNLRPPLDNFKGWSVRFQTKFPWKGRYLSDELIPFGMVVLSQGVESSHRVVTKEKDTVGGTLIFGKIAYYNRRYNYTVLLPAKLWPLVYLREKLLGNVD